MQTLKNVKNITNHHKITLTNKSNCVTNNCEGNNLNIFCSISTHFSSLFHASSHWRDSVNYPWTTIYISLLKAYVLSSYSQTSLISTPVSCMVTKPRLPLREGEQAQLDPGWKAWEGFVEDWHCVVRTDVSCLFVLEVHTLLLQSKLLSPNATKSSIWRLNRLWNGLAATQNIYKPM